MMEILRYDNYHEKECVFVKQKPIVNDEGIWNPVHPYVPEGAESTYQLVISKESFIEAYNRWLRQETEEGET